MIISTAAAPEVPTFYESKVGFLQVLHRSGCHKYLGRRFGGDLRTRGANALEHRLGCGWAKFNAFAQALTNKHISIKLRLRLFDAVITPTVLYALDTAPLSQALLNKLNTTQRCMLRRMVGWICYETDTWEERGRAMKQRMEKAMAQRPVDTWSLQWKTRRQALKDAMPTAPLWTRQTYEWDPRTCSTHNGQHPYRTAGRPRVRW